MKNAVKTPKVKYTALAVLAALFFTVTMVQGVSVLFFCVMLLWGGLVVYTLHDLKNRAAYLVFLLAFFLFLLGGEFFELYLGYEQEFTFLDALDNHAYVCLLLSLAFLHLGYCAVDYFWGGEGTSPVELPGPGTELTEKMRRITRIGLYVSVVPWFLTILDAGLYTLQNGYLSYYTDYSSRMPELVDSISDLFPVFFFLYLATLPPKKECLVPMVLYLAHSVLAMITGRRIMFGVALLVLGFYIIVRHFMAPQERWLDRKKLIAALIACPLILVGLYVQRYVRYGEAVEKSGGVFDIIFRFLSQQGTSINTIKFQKQLEGDSLGCTSLFYTIHYLRGNLLTRGIFDFPMEYYTGRTVETALYTNCLADYIMYMVDAQDFFAGYGLGTSYIAELNHDLGFLGVAMGSMVYGGLLCWLFSVKRFSYWKFAAGLLMLEEFVILPRYGADVILRPFYNLTRLLVLAAILVMLRVSKDDVAKVWNKIKKKGA